MKNFIKDKRSIFFVCIFISVCFANFAETFVMRKNILSPESELKTIVVNIYRHRVCIVCD